MSFSIAVKRQFHFQGVATGFSPQGAGDDQGEHFRCSGQSRETRTGSKQVEAKVLMVVYCGPGWKGGEFEGESEEAMRRLHG